ncbi:MAG: hypothetical protein PHC75_05385 [Burkholderiales bacterium]|nr:hypothetical protein [Burkholderiales bacterium]
MDLKFNKDALVIESYLGDNLKGQNLADALTEIKLLFTELETAFEDSNYVLFMQECISKITDLDDEAKLLEIIVPMWDAARGKQIAKDKKIDDFYYEFELLLLWDLLVKLTNSKDVDKQILAKLRTIVRRYSQMPKLWEHLCYLNGDDLTTAYTF